MDLTQTELQKQWKQSTTNSLLKQAIREKGVLPAFGQFSYFISEVRNDYRPTTQDLLEEWGITVHQFRQACNKHQILLNTHPSEQLSCWILNALNLGKTIAWCQHNFRIGFKYVQAISNQQPSPPIVAINKEDFKSLFIKQMTLAQIAKLNHTTLSNITRQLKELGIEYSMELLREEISGCVSEGIRVVDISRKYNVSVTTINKWLNTWGLQYSQQHYSDHKDIDNKHRLSASKEGARRTQELKAARYKEHLKTILPLYQQGMSNKQISQLLGISDLTVKRVLNAGGYKTVSKEQHLHDVSRTAYDKWMATIGDEYDYSLVTPEKWRSGRIPIICHKHGVFEQIPHNHFVKGANCPKCNPSISRQENEVADYISSLGVDLVRSDRSTLGIGSKELDIFVPSHKVAVEYDGLFWHSSSVNDASIKQRHLEKTTRCDELGIRLYHIFADEWEDLNKQAIWKSVLAVRLGFAKKIGARTTSIVTVNSREAREFLTANHLQGCINGKHIGLTCEGSLVSLLSYNDSRFEKGKIEILRFCTIKHTVVMGAMTKLLKELQRREQKSIISYANRRWSVGGVYEKTGFKQISITPPNYYYTKDCHSLISRYQCQKHKLLKLLGEQYDPKQTEVENMLSCGYRIIYDCGNFKYEFKKKAT